VMKYIVVMVMIICSGIISVVAQSGDEFNKVCLVSDIGRIDDGTFNQYAFEGMIRASNEFDLEFSYIETQAQEDYIVNITQCIDDGTQIIVTVGFLMGDVTRQIAEEHPEIYFIGVDQFVEDATANYAGIQFREDEAGFLVGVLAALVAADNQYDVVAGVYGMDIPPVMRYRNGFEQGVRYINPNLTILGEYIPDFNAPELGEETAQRFMDEGADVIFGAGGITGSAAIRYAAQQTIYVIGVDQDEYYTTFANGDVPEAEYLISSALKQVDVGVYDLIEALVMGDTETFNGGGNYILSVRNGGISFTDRSNINVPTEIYVAVGDVERLLARGRLETGVDPITGELVQQ
jgi:basic membrane protein A and related proteins